MFPNPPNPPNPPTAGSIQKQRARWKSLESIAQFGWCGSAAVGGYLADRHGYSFTFLITACVQGSAILIWVLLLGTVPKVEGKTKGKSAEGGAGAGAGEEGGPSQRQRRPPSRALAR